MDTQGFDRGNLTYRNLMSEAQTAFRTRLVKRAQLATTLPHDTTQISPEERMNQLRERFDGVCRRYGW